MRLAIELDIVLDKLIAAQQRFDYRMRRQCKTGSSVISGLTYCCRTATGAASEHPPARSPPPPPEWRTCAALSFKRRNSSCSSDRAPQRAGSALRNPSAPA
jgi:hypothetical protein